MSTTELATQLTHGRLLARNVLWNLFGQAAPLVMAIIAIPVLIRSIGVDRFGVLTLAWMLIGYFSLFDLGMGRGLTKMVAAKLGSREHGDIPAVVWTSLAAMLAMSVVGACALAICAHWLVAHAFRMPALLHSESTRACYILALSLPFVVCTSALRGVLEAQQRFAVLNAIRVPTGIFNFAGPLMVIPFSPSLVAIIAVLAVGRVLGFVAHLIAVLEYMPALKTIVVRRGVVGPVLSFGGWLTVSSLLGPLMMYMDRFVIGTMIGMSAVAFYATPWEMVTKLFLIPGALVMVLFPAFAVTLTQDPARAAFLMRRGTKYVFLVVFPIILIVVTFADVILRAWVGADFAIHAGRTMQWLAVGVFINCVSYLPSTLLQGAGRPDLTAKFHMLELPLYGVLLWVMIRGAGIEGAAIAWTIRVTLDAVLLFAAARRYMTAGDRFIRLLSVGIVACLLLLLLAALPVSLTIKSVFLGVSLLTFMLLTWYRALAPDERALVRIRFQNV
jgi:O-antigen/teichoic acid export membrane protein